MNIYGLGYILIEKHHSTTMFSSPHFQNICGVCICPNYIMFILKIKEFPIHGRDLWGPHMPKVYYVYIKHQIISNTWKRANIWEILKSIYGQQICSLNRQQPQILVPQI